MSWLLLSSLLFFRLFISAFARAQQRKHQNTAKTLPKPQHQQHNHSSSMATAAVPAASASPVIQRGDRTGSGNKKTFSWISRFYRKPQASYRSSSNDASQEGSDTSSVAGPFLGITQSQGNDFANNEVSSLRPTISTRAPSTSSNVAVHNIEAISSSVACSAESFKTVIDSDHERELDVVAPPLQAGAEELEATDQLATPMFHQTELPHHAVASTSSNSIMPEPLLSSENSFRSSKDSPIPSIFTTRTTDTQPTFANLAHPSSIMSSHASGANIGASDNASMLTLASSSKGPRRRRSIDTNCSMRAIAPASARGSFESSRTGFTDVRPNGVQNSSATSHQPPSVDDTTAGTTTATTTTLTTATAPSHRVSRLYSDGQASTRRSLTGSNVVVGAPAASATPATVVNDDHATSDPVPLHEHDAGDGSVHLDTLSHGTVET